MAVNPDLNRDAIVQYLTLMELAYDELPLSGALRVAQCALVESDYQFIRENNGYLDFEPGTPIQVRLQAILAIFGQEESEMRHRQLIDEMETIRIDRRALGTRLVSASDLKIELVSVRKSPDGLLDPFSHPDDE